MRELTSEDTNYLAIRGFRRVSSAPVKMPYLLLSVDSVSDRTTDDLRRRVVPLMFYHKLHTGGYESTIHPGNSSLEEAVDFIEHAIVAGRNQTPFFIPPNKKISVQVDDPDWNSVVEALFKKYN